VPERAFVGEPSDTNGNVVACERCDRRARFNVAGERLCGVHAAAGTPRHVRVVNAINGRRREAKRHL
jgi:hypothetical protein